MIRAAGARPRLAAPCSTRLPFLVLAAAVLCPPAPAGAQPARIERNVVYAMHSGLALLMDVHRPARPNGYGVVHVAGSGWRAPLDYDARPLKEAPHVRVEVPPLVEAGYTVFTVNHRATPRFNYPAPVEDLQRAVRFIRHHAAEYGIDPARIGAIGGSSGGHLVSMLGVLDGHGDPAAPRPIERESSKVQAVVARATPSDFFGLRDLPPVTLFLGAFPSDEPGSPEHRRHREASPITHVTPDDPPFLLVHGDADATIPYEQSERFAEALRGAGVQVELVRIPDGAHGATFGDPARARRYMTDAVRWLDSHLRRD